VLPQPAQRRGAIGERLEDRDRLFAQRAHHHAERGAARGADALYELVAWEAIEFAYDYSVRAPVQTITTSWDEAVIAAVSRRKAKSSARETGRAPPPTEARQAQSSAARKLS
jgi:hypothetical protein